MSFKQNILIVKKGIVEQIILAFKDKIPTRSINKTKSEIHAIPVTINLLECFLYNKAVKNKN